MIYPRSKCSDRSGEAGCAQFCEYHPHVPILSVSKKGKGEGEGEEVGRGELPSCDF